MIPSLIFGSLTSVLDIETKLINVIAFVPEEKYNTLEQRYRESKLVKAKQISLFEAEEDFEIFGNIQSPKIHTELSNGRSINLFNGKLENNFNILKK